MNRVRAMSILPATAGIITLQTIRKKNWFKSVVEFWGKFKPILIADLCVLLLILEFFSKNTGGPANTETYTKPVSYTHLDVYKRQSPVTVMTSSGSTI